MNAAHENPKSKIQNPKSTWGFFLLVLGIYLLTMSGHTYSPDEETMLETSRSVVERGTWAMSPSRSLVQVPGADGRMYSQYGPAQSFAAVPWVAVGRALGGLFPKNEAGYPLRLVLGSYNALIMAGLVALFAAFGMALGYSRRAALFSAGVPGFATFLWPHSRTFFSEPLVALTLFASFYLLYVGASRDAAPQKRVWLYLAGSGALFAVAVATKVQYVVALPAFLGYVGWLIVRTRPFNIRILALWLGGLVVGLLPLFLYNTLVFGGPLATGYGSNPGSTLTTPFFEGASGLLFSSGKGLIWYAFPIVLTAWGWVFFGRRHKAEAAFIAVVTLPVLCLFSLYSFWPGDGSWGPRYLVPIVPFLLLPILPVVQRVMTMDGGRWTVDGGRRTTDDDPLEHGLSDVTRSSVHRPPSTVVGTIVVAVVVALGFLINLPGVLVNFDTYINVVNDDMTRYYSVPASPILGHLTLLEQRAHEWALNTFPGSGTTVFKSGFSYSEGDKSRGELLPRWTTGAGLLDVHPASNTPLSMTLRLTDHRPPDLPRATLTVLVDGTAVAVQAVPVEGSPISTDYAFSVPGSSSTVTIQTDTWKPADYQEGGRNEEIGLLLESISLTQNGRALANNLTESLPPPPYYPQPRWYYDPGTHHLADLWPAYLLSTGMGRKAMFALALPVVALSLILIFVGWRLLRRTTEISSKQ